MTFEIAVSFNTNKNIESNIYNNCIWFFSDIKWQLQQYIMDFDKPLTSEIIEHFFWFETWDILTALDELKKEGKIK